MKTITIASLDCELIDIARFGWDARGKIQKRAHLALYEEVLQQTRSGVLMCVQEGRTSKSMTYAVIHDSRVYGTVVLYEMEKKGAKKFTAAPMPAFRAWAGHDTHELWGKVLDAMLDHDFVFPSGSIRELEWKFPEREGHTWHTGENERTQKIFDQMGGRSTEFKVVRGRSVPRRVKRRVTRGGGNGRPSR